ncbi:MAG: AEC family transporter [Oligoflexus sp.]|nr:AEC family transporter [Oligoflexus sp.]
MPLISLLALLGLIVGLSVERKGFASPKLDRILSKALVQLVYPCLLFSSLLLRFNWMEVKTFAIVPLSVFAVCATGLLYGKLSLGLSKLKQDATKRSYVFLAMMPNYSFVPLVIAQAFWADKGLALVALSSVGADFFLWTLAYPQIAGRRDWRKIFSPALISLILALVLLKTEIDFPRSAWAGSLIFLSWIGKATLPLSMYVLGGQLAKASRQASDTRAHQLLLVWRLILCPLLMFGLILTLGRSLPYEAKAVLLLVGSMPGAVVTVVLARLHEADGRFAATQIFLGHCLGVISVSLWQGLLYWIL